MFATIFEWFELQLWERNGQKTTVICDIPFNVQNTVFPSVCLIDLEKESINLGRGRFVLKPLIVPFLLHLIPFLFQERNTRAATRTVKQKHFFFKDDNVAHSVSMF